MGISVQNSRRNYTPPESPAPQPDHLPTGCLPEEGGFSALRGRGAGDSSPPAIPVQQPVSVACPALRGTLLTPQGFAVLGHALKSEASAWSKPPTWCLHASPRASFGGRWKRVKTPRGWRDTSEKIVQSFWWALLGEDSCSQGLQPHRCSVGQTQSEIPPEWSQ